MAKALTSQFYGFAVRPTGAADLGLALAWTRRGDANFWLRQGAGRESFLVSMEQVGDPIAFFQTERINPEQTRLHFQAGPQANPRIILLGITRLVPLIEKALALRGVRAIFFTSHSDAMAEFMQKRLGYQMQPYIDGGVDGAVLAKTIAPQPNPERGQK